MLVLQRATRMSRHTVTFTVGKILEQNLATSKLHGCNFEVMSFLHTAAIYVIGAYMKMTMDDIFGKGLAKYTFENICREDGKTPLNDRTYKYFFISCNCDTLLNKEQQAFLRMLIENKSTTDFTSRISHLVAEAKRNTQWRKQFMDFDREKAYAREDGYTDGLNDGMQQKAIEDATEFLKENVSPEVIARCVKLPLEKVLEIQKQISVTA